MNVSKTHYKNIDAIAMKSKKLTATFLPSQGGKLCSLKTADGRELLAQNDSSIYKELTLDGDYINSECSGFDDMLPTIDPCEIELPNSIVRKYHDHGEVCRIPWNAEVVADKLILNTKSPQNDYIFQKVISISNDGAIRIDYTLENLTDFELPFIYAAHLMLKAYDDAMIDIPDIYNNKVQLVFSSENNISKPGKAVPKNRIPDILHSKNFSADGDSYKYYLLEPVTSGFCSYKSQDIEFRLEFDKEILKYLGVWVNNGSFRGIHNIAFEPCTAPLDDPITATRKGYNVILPAKGKVVWYIILDYWDCHERQH